MTKEEAFSEWRLAYRGSVTDSVIWDIAWDTALESQGIAELSEVGRQLHEEPDTVSRADLIKAFTHVDAAIGILCHHLSEGIGRVVLKESHQAIKIIQQDPKGL